VGIISISFPPDQGNRRNVAFAATGAASPMGYTVGLVLSGVFAQIASWRVAYYFAAGLTAILLASAVWAVPSDEEGEKGRYLERLRLIGLERPLQPCQFHS
jgi:MFS family permease